MGETSTKPYLIRAIHEWCDDNGYTPYITVQVDAHTRVPPAHVRDGQITLNVGTMSTHRLVLGNEFIEFQTRFNGVIENISVPVGAVIAIFARETGAGMGFEAQPHEPSEQTPEALGEDFDDETEAPAIASATPKEPKAFTPSQTPATADSGAPATPKQSPRLTLVK